MAKLSRATIEEKVLSRLQDVEILEVTDKNVNYKSGPQTRTFIKYKCCKCNVIQEQQYSEIMKLYRTHKCNIDDIIDTQEDTNYIEELINEEFEKQKIRELRKDNNILIKELIKYKDHYDMFKEVFDNYSTRVYSYRYENKQDEYITPCLCVADYHIGSSINLSHTNGINRYNLDIAKERIFYATSKFINHYKNMQNYHIDRIVIFCLGDLIQGELHGAPIEFGIPKQIIESTNILLTQLDMIKEAFHDKDIDVYFVSGNHSYHRTIEHKYGKNFDVFYNSYESIIAYNLIKNGYNVITSEYNELVAKINGLRLLVHHGDNIKININNKNSIYNVLEKKKKQFMDFDNNDFDIAIQGHLHNSYYSDVLIIADSPVGLDSYSSKTLNINNGKGPGITSFCITDTGEISNYKVIRVGHIK